MKTKDIGMTLLESVNQGLTPDQKKIVEGIVNEFRPLYEATLTPQQIANIFGTVEKSGGRTAVGKGVDVAKKANEIINNIGRWIQDTTPVKAFDQKFENLKTKVGQKFPKLEKQLSGLGSWAKANPGKTAAVIGILTSLAALAGGPVGGAIAGQVLRGATELLKGEKLSTAIGKGAKTAAIGYALGKLIDVGKEVVAGIGGEKVEALRYSFEKTGEGISYVNVDPDTKQAVGQLMFQNRVLNPGDAGYGNAVKTLMKDVSKFQAENPGGADAFIKGVGSQLEESQINGLFATIVLEANLWDKFKSGAKGAAGAVAKGVQNVGKSMTHKFTMGSLESAWKKSGSPTDSEDIIALLRTLGVPQPAIDQAMKSIGVETFNRSNLPDITKLSREEQTELLAVLDKMETA